MGKQRPYPPDRREEPFERRVWDLQLSDAEALNEAARRAHYYSYLARTTEYGPQICSRVHDVLYKAMNPPRSTLAPKYLKVMIQECDRLLGRFPYPWSVDEKDADRLRDFVEQGDRETWRESVELRHVEEQVWADGENGWRSIMRVVQDNSPIALRERLQRGLPIRHPFPEEYGDMGEDSDEYPELTIPQERERARKNEQDAPVTQSSTTPPARAPVCEGSGNALEIPAPVEVMESIEVPELPTNRSVSPALSDFNSSKAASDMAPLDDLIEPMPPATQITTKSHNDIGPTDLELQQWGGAMKTGRDGLDETEKFGIKMAKEKAVLRAKQDNEAEEPKVTSSEVFHNEGKRAGSTKIPASTTTVLRSVTSSSRLSLAQSNTGVNSVRHRSLTSPCVRSEGTPEFLREALADLEDKRRGSYYSPRPNPEKGTRTSSFGKSVKLEPRQEQSTLTDDTPAFLLEALAEIEDKKRTLYSSHQDSLKAKPTSMGLSDNGGSEMPRKRNHPTQCAKLSLVVTLRLPPEKLAQVEAKQDSTGPRQTDTVQQTPNQASGPASELQYRRSARLIERATLSPSPTPPAANFRAVTHSPAPSGVNNARPSKVVILRLPSEKLAKFATQSPAPSTVNNAGHLGPKDAPRPSKVVILRLTSEKLAKFATSSTQPKGTHPTQGRSPSPDPWTLTAPYVSTHQSGQWVNTTLSPPPEPHPTQGRLPTFDAWTREAPYISMHLSGHFANITSSPPPIAPEERESQNTLTAPPSSSSAAGTPSPPGKDSGKEPASVQNEVERVRGKSTITTAGPAKPQPQQQAGSTTKGASPANPSTPTNHAGLTFSNTGPVVGLPPLGFFSPSYLGHRAPLSASSESSPSRPADGAPQGTVNTPPGTPSTTSTRSVQTSPKTAALLGYQALRETQTPESGSSSPRSGGTGCSRKTSTATPSPRGANTKQSSRASTPTPGTPSTGTPAPSPTSSLNPPQAPLTTLSQPQRPADTPAHAPLSSLFRRPQQAPTTSISVDLPPFPVFTKRRDVAHFNNGVDIALENILEDHNAALISPPPYPITLLHIVQELEDGRPTLPRTTPGMGTPLEKKRRDWRNVVMEGNEWVYAAVRAVVGAGEADRDVVLETVRRVWEEWCGGKCWEGLREKEKSPGVGRGRGVRRKKVVAEDEMDVDEEQEDQEEQTDADGEDEAEEQESEEEAEDAYDIYDEEEAEDAFDIHDDEEAEDAFDISDDEEMEDGNSDVEMEDAE